MWNFKIRAFLFLRQNFEEVMYSKFWIHKRSKDSKRLRTLSLCIPHISFNFSITAKERPFWVSCQLEVRQTKIREFFELFSFFPFETKVRRALPQHLQSAQFHGKFVYPMYSAKLANWENNMTLTSLEIRKRPKI